MNFGDWLNNFAATAGSVYGQLQQRTPTPAAAPAPVKTDYTKFIPWAIGGVVVLVILAVVMRKG